MGSGETGAGLGVGHECLRDLPHDASRDAKLWVRISVRVERVAHMIMCLLEKGSPYDHESVGEGEGGETRTGGVAIDHEGLHWSGRDDAGPTPKPNPNPNPNPKPYRQGRCRAEGGVRVKCRVRVRVRFAFCSFGFSSTEYIHAASFSMWCDRESEI